jgi:peroxidase-like protein (fragment)
VVNDYELPSSRLVSLVVHQDISQRNYHTTNLFMIIGQLVAHDLSFGLTVKDEFGDDLECCLEKSHPSCLPIKTPLDDPFYKYFKKSCLSFTRLYSALKPNCPLGPRSPASAVSSFIDANTIYGSSQETSYNLREMKGGRLKTTQLYREHHYKDLLPLKIENPDRSCQRQGQRQDMYCFEAGDPRANLQLGLTILLTLFVRQHNRIADELSYINAHWNDEKVFQETRKIIIAHLQHIIFNEYLPIVLGREAMNKYGLDLTSDYYNGYDPTVNPSIRLGFGSAAFRFGHSLIPDIFERYNKYHQKLGNYSLYLYILVSCYH